MSALEEDTMDRPMPDRAFIGMSILFRFRDLLRPRSEVLKEVSIGQGFRVLDYGCGPGAYVAHTAELVGPTGKIHALDIHPFAIQRVTGIARKKGLANVETILSDCGTGLPGESVDVVLLYDIFHHLSQPDAVLQEIHRVLKPAGILSFSDHHMKRSDIMSGVTQRQLFSLKAEGRRTYSFSKRV
jgi:ubiquinone/menaquinone biosynthesis C-methylase UbiE